MSRAWISKRKVNVEYSNNVCLYRCDAENSVCEVDLNIWCKYMNVMHYCFWKLFSLVSTCPLGRQFFRQILLYDDVEYSCIVSRSSVDEKWDECEAKREIVSGGGLKKSNEINSITCQLPTGASNNFKPWAPCLRRHSPRILFVALQHYLVSPLFVIFVVVLVFSMEVRPLEAGR